MQNPSEPFFTRIGDAFVPGPHAQGPWGETIIGRAVGGLAAWALEDAHGAEDLQPARLTVDMFRAVAMAPVTVSTSRVRDGRRIRAADAVLSQNGVQVARASAVFLLRSKQPPGQVWSASWSVSEPPPMPNLVPDQSMILHAASGGDEPDSPIVPGWNGADRKRAWIRENRALIAGEELSPFVRTAMAADVANPLANWSTAGLRFINTDYTMLLSRLPDGPDIELVATDHSSADGVSVSTASIRDRRGPIGTCAITALAQMASFDIPAPPADSTV